MKKKQRRDARRASPERCQHMRRTAVRLYERYQTSEISEKMKDDTRQDRKEAFHIWLNQRLWETLTIKNIREVYEKIVGEDFDTYQIGRYHEGGDRPKLVDVTKAREGFTHEFDTVKIVPSEM